MTEVASEDRVVHIERLVAATPERVFQYWTEPELFTQWMGPEGFSIPSYDHDFRPGGRWRQTMQSPDGRLMTVRGVFRVIEPPRETVDGGPDIAPLIVFREIPSDHEIGEGAEGDEILGEEVARRREVDGAHMLGELAKPVFDGVEILWNGLLRVQAHCVALRKTAPECCETPPPVNG